LPARARNPAHLDDRRILRRKPLNIPARRRYLQRARHPTEAAHPPATDRRGILDPEPPPALLARRQPPPGAARGRARVARPL